jgi:UDP:flavonoid glycosyltransferase YjiC (YdhE family)
MPLFILSGIGSYGDVHPLVGLGTALAARGHAVKLIANPYFAELVSAAGLEFLPVGTREDYIELSQHPDLWHSIRGPMLVLRHAAGGLARPLYELAVANYRPGETVYCAHGLDLGMRVAAEKLGAPIASVDLAPAMLWSVYDSPRLKGALLGPRVPVWLKRLQYALSDRLFVKRLVGGPLDDLRREAGLAPVRRVFGEWLHDTTLVLGLFPDWFAPPQPDWPANTRLTGFPLWDANDNAELPNEVRDFLAAGRPPVAFSPGSAHRRAHGFFAAAVQACEIVGCRAILLTKYADQLPANLPKEIGHFGFLPLSRLLRRTAAFVHHGGIGSCAQGLAAGVPQVVQPMSFDQYDNARRLVRLGVAEELSVRRFRGQLVALALQNALGSPGRLRRCAELSAQCDGASALSSACDALEALARSDATR